jgi:secreted trypsin-like serine protease
MKRLPPVHLAGLVIVALLISLFGASAQAGGPKAGTSIIGGAPAGPDFAFTVAIYEDNQFECSGSVVSPTTVVTAAHCVLGRPLSIAANRFKLGSPGAERIPVSVAIRHPAYVPKTGQNDVAVLLLGSPTTAPPIPLASAADDAAYVYPGAAFSAAGFGSRNPFNFGKEKIGTLMAADTRVAKGCGPGLFRAVMICTRGGRIGRYLRRGTCSGDSGGPLAAEIPEGPRLFGVTSFGLTPNDWVGKQVVCGHYKGREIFTRIAGVSAFIAPYL